MGDRIATTPPLISAKNGSILGGLLAAALICGSIWDLRISEALYNQDNIFGIIGAAYGEYPLGLVMLVGGIMLIMFRNKEKRGRAVTQAVLGSLLAVMGAATLVVNPLRYMPWSPVLMSIVNIVIVAALTWTAMSLLRGVDRAKAIRVATVILLVALVEIVVINLVKIGWERPRMRLLVERTDLAFSPWWSPGNPDKAELVAGGIAHEEFKSFPSGHTANAALLMMLTAFAPLKHAWERALPWLFWIGAAWGGLVALSRIIMGAHFLTDVTMGFTVTFVTILVAYRIAFRPQVEEDVS